MSSGRHAAPAPRRARPGLLAVVLVAALVLIGSAGTWAYWTDSATVDGTALQSGSMDLQINGEAVGTGTDVTVVGLATSDLTPGEYQAFDLSLANVGTPDFTWTAEAARGVTWTYVDDPLTVQLFDGSAIDDATYPRVDTCSGAALGAEVPLASVAAAVTSTGQTLAASGTAAVCVRLGMVSTAGNANQGATGTIELTFDAAQVSG